MEYVSLHHKLCHCTASVIQIELKILKIGKQLVHTFSKLVVKQLTDGLEKTVVAISKYEAEYISPSAACKEPVWLRRLLSSTVNELKDDLKEYNDSHSAVKLCSIEAINCKNKNINITFQFARQNSSAERRPGI